MKGKALKRYALLLVVILCLQEVTNAAYIPRPNALQIVKDNEERKATSDANSEYGASRVRRGLFRLILLGTALVTYTGAVIFEIVLAIKGCCSINQNICSYDNEYQAVKNNITAVQKVVDSTWTESHVKYNWIDFTNLANEALWNKVDRVTATLQRIIFDVSPKTFEALLNFNADMQNAINAGNKTVEGWTAKELSSYYNSYFVNDFTNATIAAIGYLNNYIGPLGFTYAQEYAEFHKAHVYLGRDVARMFLKINKRYLSTVNKADVVQGVKGAQQSQSNTLKKIQNYADVIKSLGIIGFSIWLTIDKINECGAMETRLKEARDAVRNDQKKFLELEKNITDFHASLIATYNTQVKGQIIQTKVFDFLTQIQDIIKNSSQVTQANLEESAVKITEFKRDIVAANDERTYDLTTNLTAALQRIEVTFKCWQLKTSTLSTIRTRCQRGSDDLQNIYNAAIIEDGTNTGDCTTKENLPITTFADIEASIKIYATEENFNFDCKLNNPTLQTNVCGDKCNKYSNAEIAQRKSITLQQVDAFLKQCTTCPLSPKDILEICAIKESRGDAGLEIAYFVKGIHGHKNAEIKAVWDACT